MKLIDINTYRAQKKKNFVMSAFQFNNPRIPTVTPDLPQNAAKAWAYLRIAAFRATPHHSAPRRATPHLCHRMLNAHDTHESSSISQIRIPLRRERVTSKISTVYKYPVLVLPSANIRD
jgi:hypothetical protein